MELFTNDFCNLEMHSRYVVLTLNENTNFTLDKATIVRERLSKHYKSSNFVLISYRKFKHNISLDIFEKGQLTNMKGLAVVSTKAEEKNIALLHQERFGKSFAFFDSLEEAKTWAQDYF